MKGFGSHLLGMGSKVYLIEHLDADELYHRYREEQDPIKRTHLQIVWLLTSGRPAKVAAEMTGDSQRWISVLVGRYSEAGVAGLGDLRRFNPGSMLDAEQRERLDRALDDPPPDGGLWTGRLVAQWICSAVWFHRDAAWNTCGAWGSLVRCRVRAMPGATSPPRSGSRPISALAWKSWRARTQTGRCRSGPSMNTAPASSRSSAGSGRAVASASWRSAITGSSGSTSSASSGRPPARWSGSSPMRSIPRCSARSWPPSPARSRLDRTIWSCS